MISPSYFKPLRWLCVLGVLATGCMAAPEHPTDVDEDDSKIEPLLAPTNIIPIGVVQGPVGAQIEDASKHESPRVNTKVTVQGVVYARIQRLDRRGKPQYGFFIQNTGETTDGDPATSDGILVYTRRYKDVRLLDSDEKYIPALGDEIVLRGKIRELFDQTMLTAPRLVRVVRTHLDPDKVVPAFEANPPPDERDAARYWEQHEGMRCRIPKGAIAQGGLKAHERFKETTAVFIHPECAVAQRDEPSHRRVFRDAHPLDDIPGERFDNENGYRIHVGSLGVKGQEGMISAQLNPMRTFDVLTEALVGPVYQFQENYEVEAANPIVVKHTLDPWTGGETVTDLNGPHVRIATFNLENLFDLRDDPGDPCDGPDDPGNDWIEPPFDYLPASKAAYAQKLRHLAAQIITGMQAPHLVLIQEAEDQDLVTVDRAGKVLDGSDGKPDVLQDLAAEIERQGGPFYESASDRDGADYRGITSGFLYDPARLERIAPESSHFLLGETFALEYAGEMSPMNTEVQNPKCINALIPDTLLTGSDISGTNVFPRAVQIGVFRLRHAVTAEPGADEEQRLYALCNHFSSRPDRKVDQRREQARLNALVARRILEQEPKAWIVVGGDLNTFPRPDEGVPAEPGDQLGPLYEAGLFNLYDTYLAARPEWAYTYVHKGQAGTLDHLFVSPALRDRLGPMWIGHMNSDWPDGVEEDGFFGATDHDPVIAVFGL